MTEVTLSRDARVRLAAVLSKLIRWNDACVVRILSTDRALGLYADAPMGVLVFLAVPLAAPPAAPVDRPVSAHRLRDIIGDVDSPLAPRGEMSVTIPDARDMPPALAAMPGRDGWIPAEKATAAEVSAAVDAALAEFDALTGAPTPQEQPDLSLADTESSDAQKRAVAEAWWSTPSWGGMPLKALHAAKSLGMLAHPAARIESATKAGWKRMQTPAGQVFVAPPESYAGIPLSVVK